jgi:hypothetical protein
MARHRQKMELRKNYHLHECIFDGRRYGTPDFGQTRNAAMSKLDPIGYGASPHFNPL